MASELKQELQSPVHTLMRFMHRLSQGIPGVTRETNYRTTIKGVTNGLDGIVELTAQATNTILDAAENIDNAVAQLRARPPAEQHDALCNRISALTTEAMQACSFHDLAGQRITTITRSLQFNKKRDHGMADSAGVKKTESLTPKDRLTLESKDGVETRGPQRATEAFTQAEIDALFN